MLALPGELHDRFCLAPRGQPSAFFSGVRFAQARRLVATAFKRGRDEIWSGTAGNLRKDEEGEVSRMGELVPTGMLIGDEAVEFEFDFWEDGVLQAMCTYQSKDVGHILTSISTQCLRATVIDGPTSLDEIPLRATDAALLTVKKAPIAIPNLDHRVRLILQGILAWEWDIRFEAPVSAFRLDGPWRVRWNFSSESAHKQPKRR
jgi:hypothetical protein